MIGKWRMIDNYIYFYHLDKFCVLPLYPDSITDSMSVTFQTTDSLARTAPVFTYSHSGPRSVSINFDLHRDLMNEVNTNVSNLKDNVVDPSSEDYIDILINYLQASALPVYRNYSAGSKAVIPPMVAVRFGDDIFIKGVIQGSVQCAYKKPIMTTVNGKKKYALISITFNIEETDPYDAEQVVQSGSFRGISATFKNGIYDSTYGSDNFDIETIKDRMNKVTQRFEEGLEVFNQKRKKVTSKTNSDKPNFIPISLLDKKKVPMIK